MNSRRQCLAFASLAVVALLVGAAAGGGDVTVVTHLPVGAKDIPELVQMFDEDQADRKPAQGKSFDYKVVAPRDQARRARVMEFYNAGLLKTGQDYLRAALILQHGTQAKDYLLAHELCVIAISKGTDALSLAAASEDRFLLMIGRPQRFGTQSRHGKMEEVDAFVTDQHRKEMNVPSLAEAKADLAKKNAASGEH